MSELAAIAALAIAIACGEAWLRAKRDHDWRVDWCVPECYADHAQQGPCRDCPARRAARR